MGTRCKRRSACLADGYKGSSSMHRYMTSRLTKMLEELVENIKRCEFDATELINESQRTPNPFYNQSGSPYYGHPFKGIFYVGDTNDSGCYTLYYGGPSINPILYCGNVYLYGIDGNDEFIDFFHGVNESFNTTKQTSEGSDVVQISSIRPGVGRKSTFNFVEHLPTTRPP